MSWCWGKGTSVICWRITRPTTTGCARTLRSTRMLRSIDLRRQSGLSHQSLGSAVSIGTTFGWHNRYTQVQTGSGGDFRIVPDPLGTSRPPQWASLQTRSVRVRTEPLAQRYGTRVDAERVGEAVSDYGRGGAPPVT